MSQLGAALVALFSSSDQEWFGRAMKVGIKETVDHRAVLAATNSKIKEWVSPSAPEVVHLVLHARLPHFRGSLSVKRLGRALERTDVDMTALPANYRFREPIDPKQKSCIRVQSVLAQHFGTQQFRQVVGSLHLIEGGPTSIVGRKCASAIGRKRPGAQLWPHWLPPANDYELAIDVELGLPLSLSARGGECVFWKQEVVELDFDVELPEGWGGDGE